MPLNSDRLIQALTLFRMIQFGYVEKNTYICSWIKGIASGVHTSGGSGGSAK